MAGLVKRVVASGACSARGQVLHHNIFLLSFCFFTLILSFVKFPISRLTPKNTRQENVAMQFLTPFMKMTDVSGD